MGTNFYLHPLVNVCEHCERGDQSEPLHVGKSSAGWCFALRVHPDNGINSLDDWRMRWAGDSVVIRDEYGTDVSPVDMERTITQRRFFRDGESWDDKNWMGYADEADFHRKNESERGPHGLLRHRIGRHCISHGDGTWDIMRGEFS